MGIEDVSDSDMFEMVLPTILGLVAALIAAVFVCLCVKRVRDQNKKLAQKSNFQFNVTRRPTAIRSPNGLPPAYLKKSPSPTTTTTKPLPGQIETSHVHDASGATSPPHSQVIKYSEANEIRPRDAVPATKTTTVTTPPANVVAEDVLDDSCGRLGVIVFKLRYLAEGNAFVVSIVRCNGLQGKAGQEKAVVANGSSKNQADMDPYVKLQLLPDKQHKVKTRVLRSTRNPVYDEDFTFYGHSLDELAAMSLHFVVLSFDRYSRDDVIGEVVWPLASVDLQQITSQQISISKEIQPRSLKIRVNGRGELLISLCWQPAASRLTIVLLKARNLPRMDVTGLADPYVKIYLLFNGQRIAKKKTHVKKRTLSPVFNESFAFDIPSTEGTATLDGVSLELMLLDWDRVTKNEVIGKLDLGGPKCSGTALHHWKEVCNSPRRQIAEWHKLNE